jgi:hypothetical protein
MRYVAASLVLCLWSLVFGDLTSHSSDVSTKSSRNTFLPYGIFFYPPPVEFPFSAFSTQRSLKAERRVYRTVQSCRFTMASTPRKNSLTITLSLVLTLVCHLVIWQYNRALNIVWNVTEPVTEPPNEEFESEYPYPLSCPVQRLARGGNYTVAIGYHVGMVNNWKAIVPDQMRTLSRCGLGSVVSKFIVSYSNGDVNELTDLLSSYPFAASAEMVESTGLPWEGVALNSIREYCLKQSETTVVFYFHNKGASRFKKDWKERIDEFGSYSRSLYWRKYMEYFTLERPEICIDRIVNRGASTCGVQRLLSPSIHYAGNFWAASCAYIKTLPSIEIGSPKDRSKYLEAEMWLGKNQEQKRPDRYVSLHAPNKRMIKPYEYSDYAHRWGIKEVNDATHSA